MTNEYILDTHHSPIATMSKPWHRHKLVWMLITIPGVAVIMGVVMIWLAISTNAGLVVDDYYKEGLAINQDLKRDDEAVALGLGAKLRIEKTGDLVTLEFDKGKLAEYPDTLELGLYFTTHTGFDQKLQLLRGLDGKYVGYLHAKLRDGAWNVEVSRDNWRLMTRADVRNGLDASLSPKL
jgi:uncharacterized protein